METKKKVFISGPMSGYENHNTPAFNEMEKKLISLGYSVFNPAWMKFDDAWDMEDRLSIDYAVIRNCDAIVQLNGWDKSNGANGEYSVALSFGKEVISEDFINEQYRQMEGVINE